MVPTSKLDILAEGREQGILLARRLVEAAQKEGRDPLEAIDNELGYRKRYKQQSRFTKKEIGEAYESYREETTVTLMSIACIVLWDVFKFGGKHRLPRFLAECDVYTKALAEGLITWKDIDNILVDKCGLDFIPEVLRR